MRRYNPEYEQRLSLVCQLREELGSIHAPVVWVVDHLGYGARWSGRGSLRILEGVARGHLSRFAYPTSAAPVASWLDLERGITSMSWTPASSFQVSLSPSF